MKLPLDKEFLIECQTPKEAILHETMPVVGSLYKVQSITAERLQNMPMYFCVKVELVLVATTERNEET